MPKKSPKPRAERIATELPVVMGEATGLTRNVSATGIYFEIDADCKVGSRVSFLVELNTGGQKINLKCQGDIVRTEARDSRKGVAVAIRESVMEVVG